MATTGQRGYGYAHKQERARIQRLIDQGVPVYCCWPDCGVQLNGTAWRLDHTDDRGGYRGPACIPCNQSDGARKTNAIRRGKRHGFTSRRW